MYKDNISTIDDLIAKLNVMHDEFSTSGKIAAEVSIHRIYKVALAMGARLYQIALDHG